MFHVVVENKTSILFEGLFNTRQEAETAVCEQWRDGARMTMFNAAGTVLLDESA